MDTAKISRWVKGCLFRERNGAYVYKFTLKHVIGVAGSAKQSEVDGWEVPERPGDDVVDDLLSCIETAATDATEGYGGRQRFVLYAFTKKQTEAVASLPFYSIADKEVGEGDAPYEAEPATEKGQLSQQMRHNEALARVNVLGAEKSFKFMERMLERAHQRIEFLEDRDAKNMEIMDALQQKEQERKLSLEEAKAKIETRNKITERLLPLITVVANRVAGAKLLGNGEKHPMEQMLKDLAESITPEQFETVQKAFTPDQLILLVELMKASQKEDAKPNGA